MTTDGLGPVVLPTWIRDEFGNGECLLRAIDYLDPSAGLRCRRAEHAGRHCQQRWLPPRQREAA